MSRLRRTLTGNSIPCTASRRGKVYRKPFCAVFCVAGYALSVMVAVAARQGESVQSVILPRIIGPIPVTSNSHPFLAANHAVEPLDLSNLGYMEKEYLVSGYSNVYDYASNGGLKIKSAGAPYTTRILVRRPMDPRRFSGNVVMELLNPSDKFDADLVWKLAHEYLIANGDVYVGITSKPIAAEFLKRYAPDRYESLSWANPIPVDQTCPHSGPSLLPGHSSPLTEDGLIWDILTQVGSLLKSGTPMNPLAD